MYALRLALLLSIPLGLHAFSDTCALLAWSSTSSSTVDAVSSRNQLTIQSQDVASTLMGEDICGYDAVVVVEQPGLHASDFKTLPKTSYLLKKLKSAPSHYHLPYVQPANPSGLARDIAKRCNTQFVELAVSQSIDDVSVSGKHAISVDLPEIDTLGHSRREAMRRVDEQLSRQLAGIEAAFPSHLVILAGTTPSSYSKRQSSDLQRSLPGAFSPSTSATKKNLALPTGGILHRYQLLTPALITTLGITFLVLMPLMLMVIYALAGIKSPIRSDGFKQSHDKKNQ